MYQSIFSIKALFSSFSTNCWRMYRGTEVEIHSLAWIAPSIKTIGLEVFVGSVLTFAKINSRPSNDVPGTSNVTSCGYSSASCCRYSLIYNKPLWSKENADLDVYSTHFIVGVVSFENIQSFIAITFLFLYRFILPNSFL